jgi:GNAT superfamily N-acetyltransferase
MIREHVRDIPQFAPPAGFGFRPIRPDNVGLWLDIWRDAEPHFQIGDDMFAKEFGADWARIAERCFLLFAADGAAVGTISVWVMPAYRGMDYGRIHWVAIRRACQGAGLGKVLMTHAMNRGARLHERIMLNTQSKRIGAIKLYLDFGFEPNLELPGAPAVWAEIGVNLRTQKGKQR